MLVQGPGGATCNNQRLGPVVVLQLIQISVGVLLSANEVVIHVEVNGIGLPGIRGSCESCTGGHVLELAGQVAAIVVSKDPVVAASQVVGVVVLISIQQPDTSHTQRFYAIVKILVSHGGGVVSQSNPSASTINVVIQICVLVGSCATVRQPDLVGCLKQVLAMSTAAGGNNKKECECELHVGLQDKD